MRGGENEKLSRVASRRSSFSLPSPPIPEDAPNQYRCQRNNRHAKRARKVAVHQSPNNSRPQSNQYDHASDDCKGRKAWCPVHSAFFHRVFGSTLTAPASALLASHHIWSEGHRSPKESMTASQMHTPIGSRFHGTENFSIAEVRSRVFRGCRLLCTVGGGLNPQPRQRGLDVPFPLR